MCGQVHAMALPSFFIATCHEFSLKHRPKVAVLNYHVVVMTLVVKVLF